MVIFSKFSIWDYEVKEFINSLSVEAKLPKEQLTEWFYNEAVIIFIESQSTSYRKDVALCQAKYGHRPIISPIYMLGQKFNAFMDVGDQLIKKFATNLSTSFISTHFNSFASNAIAKHVSFNTIQAKITTEINQLLDNNPNLPPVNMSELVVEKFLEYKNSNPEHSQEIDDQISDYKGIWRI